jgi:hypothetical protein
VTLGACTSTSTRSPSSSYTVQNVIVMFFNLFVCQFGYHAHRSLPNPLWNTGLGSSPPHGSEAPSVKELVVAEFSVV